MAMLGQTPLITEINPRFAVAGSQDIGLGMTGSNFAGASVIVWNGAPLATVRESPTQLSATVRAALLALPGTVKVMVQTPSGLLSNEVTFTILPQLTIVTATLPPLTPGANYTAALSASGGVPPYRWSPNGAFPVGFSLNDAGTISGFAATSDPVTFNVKVTDATNVSVTKAFIATAEPPALRITTAELAGGRVGQAYLARVEAAGGAPPYRWSVTQGSLPAGLNLDSASGTVSGTPAVPGTAEFAVEARDAANRTVSRRFSVAVVAAPPAALTIVTPASLPPGAAGQAYNQVLTASGGTSPYRWAVKSGDAAGLSLGASTGTLEGVPRGGAYTFEVQVTDSRSETAARTFTLTVGTSLTIGTGAVLPAGIVGADYSQDFTVTGGIAPYIWTLTGGAVPGLSFDPATAILSGTPTSPGSFQLSLRVRDTTGATAARTFSLAVTTAALSFTSAGAIPDAKLTEPYTHTISATGGLPPYTWVASGLPDGLAIGTGTGIISGTPALAGEYLFTVRVTDSLAATAAELYRLKVVAIPVPQLRLTGLPAVAKAADQLPVGFELDSTYPNRIAGQLTLTFAPDSGGGDSTIRFSTGGRTAAFSVAAGSTEVTTSAPLAIQTGTVAGTITITASLTAGGADITPARPPSVVLRIERAAPVIQRVRFSRNGNTLTAEVTGYSTSRDLTQASFSFSAGPGQTLQTSTVTASVEDVFSRWFQDPAATAFGSQFVFTQNFTVSGEAASVNLTSVTLTNRVGSTSSSTIAP